MDLAGIVLQGLYPTLDVCSSAVGVVAGAESVAGHHGGDLGPELLAGVLLGSEASLHAFLECGPVQPVLVGGGVAQLVERYLVVRFGAGKLVALGERHLVVFDVVESSVAGAVANLDTALRDDGLGPLLRQPGRLLVAIAAGRELEPLRLLGVEHDIGSPDGPIELLPSIEGLSVLVLANLPFGVSLGDPLLPCEKDDVLASLALLNVASHGFDLAIGAPTVVAVPALLGRHRQVEGVAPGVGSFGVDVCGERRLAGFPWLLPWCGPRFHPVDELVRKLSVVVLLFGSHGGGLLVRRGWG